MVSVTVGDVASAIGNLSNTSLDTMRTLAVNAASANGSDVDPGLQAKSLVESQAKIDVMNAAMTSSTKNVKQATEKVGEAAR